MSRILEFQPTDEQTIVSRVLVELHQAIDISFPNAKPTAKQFSRTVLTNQGESTRIDNIPPASDERLNAPLQQEDSPKHPVSAAQISMTPKTGAYARHNEPLLHTAQLRTLLGESYYSRLTKKVLVGLLLLGMAVFAWMILMGQTWPRDKF